MAKFHHGSDNGRINLGTSIFLYKRFGFRVGSKRRMVLFKDQAVKVSVSLWFGKWLTVVRMIVKDKGLC